MTLHIHIHIIHIGGLFWWVLIDTFLWWMSRFQYLSSAVLQAKNATIGSGTISSSTDVADGGLLELLEGKLAVLRFQIKIKEELELLIVRSEAAHGIVSGDTDMVEPFPSKKLLAEEAVLGEAKEKLEDLGRDLKSISQLYNDYAVPFEMWEVRSIVAYAH